ncbi:hypothetical protein ACOIE4_002436 [Klebsiella variicola]|uniref:hypothetical protein n=1 Tax=Klebsiella TaxID=570 RepID=UPI00116014DA|nr:MULTISPECIES: hypothetical protein [Klebsiella]EIW9272231.1 hypothetical protein [Klebsiella variicola]EIY5099947.1 hypothetical protein [Klebsiella variicola]MBM4735065.1 hypothetical protein [Klebsiella variicola]MBM7148567.1 hypothetical protein [Klebsiella variicola]MBR7365452.1 hypothetical protein [Klebsiella variicola]
MEKLIIALALLSPLAAQANLWELSCGGINMTLAESKVLNVMEIDGNTYIFSGGVNMTDGNTINIFDKYLPEAKTPNAVAVDANDHIALLQRGNDDATTFQTADSRGVHNCSIQSFKAGE